MQCFKCGKTLEKVFEDSEHQPYEACNFTARGQYGCTVFDPMGSPGPYLMIHVCDECLVAFKDRVTLFEQAHQPPRIPDVASPWNPDVADDFSEEKREEGLAKLWAITEKFNNKNASTDEKSFVDLSLPDGKEIPQDVKNKLVYRILADPMDPEAMAEDIKLAMGGPLILQLEDTSEDEND